MQAEKRDDQPRDHGRDGDWVPLADLDKHTVDLLRQKYGHIEPDPQRDHRRRR